MVRRKRKSSLESSKLFQTAVDVKIEEAEKHARKIATRNKHQLTEFISVKVKDTYFCRSAGCKICGTGVTFLLYKGDRNIIYVGDCMEKKCGGRPV